MVFYCLRILTKQDRLFSEKSKAQIWNGFPKIRHILPLIFTILSQFQNFDSIWRFNWILTMYQRCQNGFSPSYIRLHHYAVTKSSLNLSSSLITSFCIIKIFLFLVIFPILPSIIKFHLKARLPFISLIILLNRETWQSL